MGPAGSSVTGVAKGTGEAGAEQSRTGPGTSRRPRIRLWGSGVKGSD